MNAHPITPERITALLEIRDSMPGNQCTVQCDRLLAAMRKLGHVSTFEAMRFLDVYYPPARKLDLVKAGYRVITSWRVIVTEAGKRHRVGVYSLERG